MKQKTLETLEFIGAAIIIAEVLMLAGLHINAHAGTYQELQAKYSNTVEVGIAPGETEAQESVVKISEEIPLGSFKLTAYCGCTKCCGKNAKKGANGEWLAITRTGVRAQKNHTISVDPKVIPLGTEMFIVAADGTWVYGYALAGDTGGFIKGNRIDLFYDTRDECITFGRQDAIVYILTNEE